MPTLQQQNLWSRRSPWVTATAALALAAAFHLLAHRPATHRLAAVRGQLHAARAELAAARADLAELPRVEQEVQDTRRRLAASRRLPQNQDLGQFIRDVTAFGEDAALSKFTVQLGVPARRDLLSEIPVSLNFEGDFLGVCQFLRRAEQMPRLTSMRGINIRSVDPAAGTVEVQLSMNLYFADGR